MTTVPGIKVRQLGISDASRQGRGDEGAIDDALAKLKERYTNLLRNWPIGKRAEFHVVLTMDYPRPGGG